MFVGLADSDGHKSKTIQAREQQTERQYMMAHPCHSWHHYFKDFCVGQLTKIEKI
jgi:hypothetical protein